MFLLSSKQLLYHQKKDKKKKPDAYLFYNSTKGGFDTAYEMLRCYSAKARVTISDEAKSQTQPFTLLSIGSRVG